jgi:hypothetical protein
MISYPFPSPLKSQDHQKKNGSQIGYGFFLIPLLASCIYPNGSYFLKLSRANLQLLWETYVAQKCIPDLWDISTHESINEFTYQVCNFVSNKN